MDDADAATRREALARLGGLGAGLALAGCSTATPPTATPSAAPELPGTPLPDRPNVVVVYVDHLGWYDTGFQGSEYYETPNLDALAASGLVATAGEAAAPNCAFGATRPTGRWPRRSTRVSASPRRPRRTRHPRGDARRLHPGQRWSRRRG